MHPKITLNRVMKMVQRDQCEGICLKCGLTAYEVEPDAREYRCYTCGQKAVHGAQEILFSLAG